MIVKSPSCDNFTTVKNLFVNDSRLSWGARGIGLYLLSKPCDWKVHVNDLVNQSPLGEKGVRSLLAELEANGYISKVSQRGEDGLYVGGDWVMCDEPRAGKRHPAKRHPVKDALLKTDNELKTEEDKQPSLLEEIGALEAAVPDSTYPRQKRKIAAGAPIQSLLALWAKHFPVKPQPLAMRGTRLRLLANRWQDGIKRNQYTQDNGLEWWDSFLGWCATCKAFQKPFFNFDFLLKPDNFDKIIEGNYRD